MLIHVDVTTSILSFIGIFALGIILGFLLMCLTQIPNLHAKRKHSIERDPEYLDFDLKGYEPDASYRQDRTTIDGDHAKNRFR